MSGFLGIQQCFSKEHSSRAESLVIVQAPGSHGLGLSSLDGRLSSRQPLVRHNLAHEAGKIVDLLIDEGALHPEWGWISESRAIGCEGNGAGRPTGLQ
jgi:hypothetical protein